MGRCLSGIQISLGVLYFYLLNLAILRKESLRRAQVLGRALCGDRPQGPGRVLGGFLGTSRLGLIQRTVTEPCLGQALCWHWGRGWKCVPCMRASYPAPHLSCALISAASGRMRVNGPAPPCCPLSHRTQPPVLKECHFLGGSPPQGVFVTGQGPSVDWNKQDRLPRPQGPGTLVPQL